MTDYPLMGVVRSCDPFIQNFAPNHIFGIHEARHFKFRVLIDTQEYGARMIITPIPDVFRVT